MEWFDNAYREFKQEWTPFSTIKTSKYMFILVAILDETNLLSKTPFDIAKRHNSC